MTLGGLRIIRSLDGSYRKVGVGFKKKRRDYYNWSHPRLVEVVGFQCWQAKQWGSDGHGFPNLVEGWIRWTLQPFVLNLSLHSAFSGWNKCGPATSPLLGSVLSLLSWTQEAVIRTPSGHCEWTQTHSLGPQKGVSTVLVVGPLDPSTLSDDLEVSSILNIGDQ